MTYEWTYDGIEILDTDIPVNAFGFVYKITRIKDGKFYYGQKQLWRKKISYKQIVHKVTGVKKRKKSSVTVPSDWREYWSSSQELIDDVSKIGKDCFVREILCFCENKGTMNYIELKYQMDDRVIENRDMSYNGIVNARIHWSHVKPIIPVIKM